MTVINLVGEKRVGAPIKVLIVDDDEMFHQQARTALESAGGVTLVGEAAGGQRAVAMIQETHPDVVLLGIDVEWVVQIRTLSPQAKIIVLHDEGQERLVLDAFKKGALGHLVRRKASPDEIVAAVRAVSRGEAVISSGVAGRILDQLVQERRIFERR